MPPRVGPQAFEGPRSSALSPGHQATGGARMASNQGNQANRGDQGDQGGGRERGSSSDSRGFAGMSEDEQRRIARMGGEASATQQKRDADGQFAGNRGGSSGGRGQSSGGSSDGGSRGGSQGGGSRSGSQGGGSRGGSQGGGSQGSQGGGRSQGTEKGGRQSGSNR